MRWPNKVIGLYIILADETMSGFGSSSVWTPQLYPYQQTAVNVLYFSFIHPRSMKVPQAFINLAKTRGTGTVGAVPSTTMIVFSIGGYAYSIDTNPWPWLTSQSAAEAMAIEVAKWPSLYNCDGIDLDLEEGAGDQPDAGPNMVHFVRKLRQLVPNIYIGQPTYGYPKVPAENYIINQSWDANGVSSALVDSIGLMVYTGATSLEWTNQYTNGPEQWSGSITCRAPSDTILVGANGITSATDVETLSNACINSNFRGIMIWYGSVMNGFVYGQEADTSKSATSAQAFETALNSFKTLNG